MKSLIVKKDDIAKNIDIIKNKSNSKIIAVVKADGYGLSTVALCQHLVSLNVDFFAVTELSDALEIRQNIEEKVDILYLGPVFSQDIAEKIVENDITAMIFDKNVANLLSLSATKLQKNALGHIKINSGMNRYGFTTSEQVLDVLKTEKVEFRGIFTHLHSSLDRKTVDVQMKIFNEILNGITDFKFEMKHVCNSYATMNYSDLHFDAVRVGTAILGRVSGNYGFSKVGYLEANINSINDLKKGQTVGYRAGFKAKSDMKTAVIDAGSFDGFDLVKNDDIFTPIEVLKSMYRKFKMINRAIYVEINGKKCKVLGKIAMNACVVDITNVDCKISDIAKIQVNTLYVHNKIERKYI